MMLILGLVLEPKHIPMIFKLKYILATIHRRKNITSKEKLSAIFSNLDKISYEKNIVMPLHPHTKKMLQNFKIQTNVNFIEPVGYIPMLSLLNGVKWL